MAEQLLQGYAQFQERYFEERAFAEKLAKKGQSPKALYIGCSDSRVVPELLTQAGIGDLFVVRNIANHVPAFEHHDLSVGAAVEYAVAHLKVPDIIVCGHDGCGGVKAALEGLHPLSEHVELVAWLKDLDAAVAAAKGSGLTGDALWRHAVELHTLDSVDALIRFPVVRAALEAGALHVHAWVYDIYSTKLRVFDAGSRSWHDPLAW